MVNREYVFRRYAVVEALVGTKTEAEMVEWLKEDQLSKGYVPAGFKTEVFETDSIANPQKIIRATCVSAYFGKKAAREYFDVVSKMLEEMPDMFKFEPLND
jgi:hypothetical protein